MSHRQMMGRSPSPTSPLAGPYRHNYPNRSPSPPTQPMSKKDKRRSQHMAQQQELQDDFQQNREAQYRQQLVALQSDMNLITHADPYQPEPIDDSPDEIARVTEQAAAGTPYQSELSALAGKWYSTFIAEVNDAKEQKELALITTANNHEKKLERLKHECDFRLHLAAEEYEHMSSTLRERLTQQLSSKRQRLMKEKEQLDIADTNALLLHPSQFTITNPASPAGQTARTTRNRRGEHDGLNGYQDGASKRKRKFLDEDVGSPVRNGTSTPAGGRGRPAEALTHQNAPLYSIANLFTEKELNFQSHQAQIASRHFFSTSVKEGEANGKTKRGKDDGEANPADSNDASEDEEELEAPGMERTASQNVHVTRSTRTIGGLSGLNILSEIAEKQSTRPTLPYATLHSHQQKSGTFLPSASRLLDTEIEDDLLRFAQVESQPKTFFDEKAVEDALAPISVNRSNLAPDWPVYMDIHLSEIDPRTAKAV